jgi:hypothetical protein
MNPDYRKNIIWLASYPKSGNTWFRVFLSNLFSGSDQPVNINSLNPSQIASSRSIFEEYTGIVSSELTNSEIRELRPKVYRLLSQESESNFYIKVHDAWQLNNRKEPIFPPEVTKAVIYIVRNPFDVARSYANHNGIKLNTAIDQLNCVTCSIGRSKKSASNQLEQALFSWSGHVKSWVDQPNLPVHVMRYEDLLTHPTLHFKNALNFLGIAHSEQQIELAVKNSDFSIVAQQEKEFGFKEKPQKSKQFFHSGKASDLDQLNGNHDFEKLKEHHAEVMKRYNYFI